jgi:hypothetical protein
LRPAASTAHTPEREDRNTSSALDTSLATRSPEAMNFMDVAALSFSYVHANAMKSPRRTMVLHLARAVDMANNGPRTLFLIPTHHASPALQVGIGTVFVVVTFIGVLYNVVLRSPLIFLRLAESQALPHSPESSARLPRHGIPPRKRRVCRLPGRGDRHGARAPQDSLRPAPRDRAGAGAGGRAGPARRRRRCGHVPCCDCQPPLCTPQEGISPGESSSGGDGVEEKMVAE